jgi:hypothetical protein
MKIFGILLLLILVLGTFAFAYSQTEDSKSSRLVGDTKFTAWYGFAPNQGRNKMVLGPEGASPSNQAGFATLILDIDDARTIRVEDFIVNFATNEIPEGIGVNVSVNGIQCEQFPGELSEKEYNLPGCIEYLELGLNELGFEKEDGNLINFNQVSLKTIYVSGVKNPASFEG